jgi:DNA-directed RNA polymerase beta subunit
MQEEKSANSIGTDLSNEIWTIINSYFEENPNWLARHQIDSYNDFVENKIPLIMKNINKISAFMYDKIDKEITYKVDIYLGGKSANRFRIAPPTIYDHKTQQMRPLYPNEARLKNLTYGFDIFVDLELEYSSKKGDEVLFEGLKLADTNFLNNIYIWAKYRLCYKAICAVLIKYRRMP